MTSAQPAPYAKTPPAWPPQQLAAAAMPSPGFGAPAAAAPSAGTSDADAAAMAAYQQALVAQLAGLTSLPGMANLQQDLNSLLGLSLGGQAPAAFSQMQQHPPRNAPGVVGRRGKPKGAAIAVPLPTLTAQDLASATALLEAADQRNEGKCRALVQNPGFRFINEKSKDGRTALHLCMLRKLPEDLCLSIARHPEFIQVNAVDTFGYTLLILAASKGMGEVALAILDNDSFIGMNAQDKWGASALHWAADQDLAQVCEKLLENPQFVEGNRRAWSFAFEDKTALDVAEHRNCKAAAEADGGQNESSAPEVLEELLTRLLGRDEGAELMRLAANSRRLQTISPPDMQKTPMLMDKSGKFLPSTYCSPGAKPKYETGEEDLDEVLIEELDMIEDQKEKEDTKRWQMKELCDLRLGMEESTLSMLVQIPLESAAWREIQRDLGTSDVFALDIPFGGQQVNFILKSDPESPILQGKLGGCVWRKGCRWCVEQRNGRPLLELYMPKQTPEPWSFVVEGYHNLARTAYDPYQQMILDGLWDDEAIEEKVKGDQYFRESEYRAAVKCFSRALERNPDSYITLTNRSAARLAFETEKFKLEEVLEDAQRALEINPTWHKAKFREGITLSKLHRYDEAVWALEEGQRMDRTNHQGWEEEIQAIKEERIKWHNRKKLSYLNDVE
ncbi:unnamed protein product [Polarella glacialis]|uniref:Uncharacterized protein n=1 Tax=Polarella glacialis TaxID=89957 RepID=A0A813DP97_POLGL|nr:unnamed protein product [Polarella glacialis]